MDNEGKNGIGIFHPVWLLISTTAPQAVLIALAGVQYSSASASPDAGSTAWAIGLGAGLLVLAASCTAYAVFCLARKRSLDPRVCLPLLGAYVPLLYLFTFWYFTTQWWVREDNFFFITMSLGIPCIIYGFVLAVAWRQRRAGSKRSWPSFLISLAVPAAFYLFFMLVLPAMKWGFSSDLARHAVAVMCVLSVVVFFFFLLRWAYLLLTRGLKKFLAYELVFRIVVSLVLPLTGLAVYNAGGALMLGGLWFDDVLGSFGSPWFYVLAALAGISLSVPNPRDLRLRLSLFGLRVSLLPFSAYFFFVFLPYAPLAPILTIFFGLGILILAPLGLFLLHLLQLARDLRAVRTSFPPALPILIAAAAFLVIPCGTGIGFLRQRAILNEALRYAYQPDYSMDQTAPAAGWEISSILEEVVTLKRSRGTPVLSACFRWIVLDNMTLSGSALTGLRALYGGGGGEAESVSLFVATGQRRNDGVRLTGLDGRSVWDKKAGAWVSKVDLKITNSTRSDRKEYASAFRLPPGAFISGYYLMIGDRREEGMVVEKRAALWVFQSILARNRDPGILYFLGDGSIALEVFPFSANEIRRTGFTVVHKEPFTLELDGREVRLGASGPGITAPVEASPGSGVYYVSAEAKRLMPTVRREPYYHFILDCSAAAGSAFSGYRKTVDSFLRGSPAGSAHAKISFVNASMKTADFNSDWEAGRPASTGGFFLDRALKKILLDHYLSAEARYPVIVVVSPDLEEAVFLSAMDGFSFLCPEMDCYYHLDGTGGRQPYSLLINPASPYAKLSPAVAKPHPTVAWRPLEGRPVYLRLDQSASIVFSVDDGALISDASAADSAWAKGILMQAAWFRRALHPFEADVLFMQVFKESVSSRLLTPAVSFIAVENEDQKRQLRIAQERTLKAGGALKEAADETMSMSEPGWAALGAVAVVLIGAIFRKRRA